MIPEDSLFLSVRTDSKTGITASMANELLRVGAFMAKRTSGETGFPEGCMSGLAGRFASQSTKSPGGACGEGGKT